MKYFSAYVIDDYSATESKRRLLMSLSHLAKQAQRDFKSLGLSVEDFEVEVYVNNPEPDSRQALLIMEITAPR